MEEVTLVFEKAKITKYIPPGNVELQLEFNDGKNNTITKMFEIKNPSEHAKQWLNEARQKVRKTHKKRSLEDHPLANQVIIKYPQDQEKINERFTKFLIQVKERLNSARLENKSYYEIERRIQGSEASFTSLS